MPSNRNLTPQPDLDDAAGSDVPRLPWWARGTRAPVLSPRQVRARTLRGTLGAATLALAVGLGLIWVLKGSEVPEVEAGPEGSLAYRQSLDALVGGCGPRYVFTNTREESGLIPTRTAQGKMNYADYRTVVPMFGGFWDSPAPTGQRFWGHSDGDAPHPENVLRNLWDGQMVVYYTSKAAPLDVSRLQQTASEEPELDILIVPWRDELGMLPGGRDFAFATWNASQTCHRYVASALGEFRDAHPASDAPGANGTAPPRLPQEGTGSAVVGSGPRAATKTD